MGKKKLSFEKSNIDILKNNVYRHNAQIDDINSKINWSIGTGIFIFLVLLSSIIIIGMTDSSNILEIKCSLGLTPENPNQCESQITVVNPLDGYHEECYKTEFVRMICKKTTTIPTSSNSYLVNISDCTNQTKCVQTVLVKDVE